MEDFDLQHQIDRELKRLPVSRAPRTLLPRVMAAIAAPKPLRWYSRPWLTWPRHLQIASALLVVALGAGGWWAWNEVPSLVQRVNQAAAVSRALWSVLLGPIAFVVLGLTVLVVLACAAAWTAVSRVTFGEASPQ